MDDGGLGTRPAILGAALRSATHPMAAFCGPFPPLHYGGARIRRTTCTLAVLAEAIARHWLARRGGCQMAASPDHAEQRCMESGKDSRLESRSRGDRRAAAAAAKRSRTISYRNRG